MFSEPIRVEGAPALLVGSEFPLCPQQRYPLFIFLKLLPQISNI